MIDLVYTLQVVCVLMAIYLTHSCNTYGKSGSYAAGCTRFDGYSFAKRPSNMLVYLGDGSA